ncbi:MAG: hypothetical protein ACREJX_13980, partial [Polyangiaceae bacterium]
MFRTALNFDWSVHMQTRREFLGNATVTLLLIPLGAMLACGSSNSSPGGSTGNNGVAGCDNGIGETSTVANNHTHTICVLNSDLTAPPAAGVTYVTSNVEDHTHNVT